MRWIMKSNSLILGILLTVFLVECKKDVAPLSSPPIVHSPYEGTFIFTNKHSVFYGTQQLMWDTTFTSIGSVTKNNQGKFLIQSGAGGSIVDLNQDGSFSSPTSDLTGRFSDLDHLSFNNGYSLFGNLSIDSVSGVRQ